MLGLSSPAEREHIESEYFEDDDAFQEMLTAEDDLIDAYARGELAGEERRRFEKGFVSSFGGRDRVQFARAFAGAVSAPRPVETKHRGTWLDSFKNLQSPGLLRTATTAAVIVFVVALAWLVIDRRRMTNELRELRAESANLSKRVETLQTSDNERTRRNQITGIFPELPRKPDKPRRRERPELKKNPEQTASNKPESTEKLINSEDVTLGNTFVSQTITELPLNARNVTSLLTLQPGTTRAGHVGGGRADQANITLYGVDVEEPLNTYFLKPWNTSSGETSIHIPNSLNWIRFQIAIETPVTYNDYRVIIKTADGRAVTSVDWIEPVTPNQTIIDTPAIATVDLPSGAYVLVLMGKDADGSFVKVTECFFRVIKY